MGVRAKSKSPLEMKISENVKAIREKKGYSQNEFAELIGVSKGFIGQVESPNSQSKYSLDQLNLIAHLLTCTLHDLIPKKPVKDW